MALFIAFLSGSFITGVVGTSSTLTAHEGEIALRDALRVELETTAQTVSRLVDPALLGQSSAAFKPLKRYTDGNRYVSRVYIFKSTQDGMVKTLYDQNRASPALAPGTTISPTREIRRALTSTVATTDWQDDDIAGRIANEGYAPIFGSQGSIVAYVGIEIPAAKFAMRLSQIGGAVTIGWLLGLLLGLLAGLVVYVVRIRQIAESQALASAKAMLEEANESLEERVAQRTEELRQAMEAKSVFLTTAGHELRTPLNGLIGMTTLVLDSAVGEEPRQFLTLAKESAEQLTTKVNQLLDLASLESGQLRLEFETANAAEEVRRVIDIFTPKVNASGLRFVHWIDPELNRKFFIPRRRVIEIINNLLDNALKFTETGVIYFTAGVIHRRDGSEWIELNVQDTGVGIDEAVRERIFEHRDSFVSLPSHKSGLGIGLAIARRICHLMGGVIEVVSEEGGSRFRVLLPLPPVEAGLAA